MSIRGTTHGKVVCIALIGFGRGRTDPDNKNPNAVLLLPYKTPEETVGPQNYISKCTVLGVVFIVTNHFIEQF